MYTVVAGTKVLALDGFSVLKIQWVRKIINDGVYASTRKSEAHFQII